MQITPRIPIFSRPSPARVAFGVTPRANPIMEGIYAEDEIYNNGYLGAPGGGDGEPDPGKPLNTGLTVENGDNTD